MLNNVCHLNTQMPKGIKELTRIRLREMLNSRRRDTHAKTPSTQPSSSQVSLPSTSIELSAEENQLLDDIIEVLVEPEMAKWQSAVPQRVAGKRVAQACQSSSALKKRRRTRTKSTGATSSQSAPKPQTRSSSSPTAIASETTSSITKSQQVSDAQTFPMNPSVFPSLSSSRPAITQGSTSLAESGLQTPICESNQAAHALTLPSILDLLPIPSLSLSSAVIPGVPASEVIALPEGFALPELLALPEVIATPQVMPTSSLNYFTHDVDTYLRELFRTFITPSLAPTTQTWSLMQAHFYERIALDMTHKTLSDMYINPTPCQTFAAFAAALCSLGLLSVNSI